MTRYIGENSNRLQNTGNFLKLRSRLLHHRRGEEKLCLIFRKTKPKLFGPMFLSACHQTRTHSAHWPGLISRHLLGSTFFWQLLGRVLANSRGGLTLCYWSCPLSLCALAPLPKFIFCPGQSSRLRGRAGSLQRGLAGA